MSDLRNTGFLQENKLSSCVLSTSGSHVNENFYYFSGISKTSHVTATLVLTKNDRLILTNRLEYNTFRGKGKIILVETKKDVEKSLKMYCGRRPGMDFSYTSAARCSKIKKILGVKVIDVSEQIGKMREIKSSSEIKKIKEACRIAEDVLDSVEKLLKKSVTERELALELDYAARKNGAESVAYPPIVANGKNSSFPHHIPDNTKIKKGLLLIDFGVVYDGYCSDLTRIFSVGVPSSRMRQVYETVYKSQQVAIKVIKSGSKAADVHLAANKILENELGQKLIHSIGHGLGIEVHDYPEGINEKSAFVLKNNMVVTIEPGYYSTEFGGIRIEDDIVVRKRPILLSKAPNSVVQI